MFRRHVRTRRRFFQTPKLGMDSELSWPLLAMTSKSGNILGPSTLLFTGRLWHLNIWWPLWNTAGRGSDWHGTDHSRESMDRLHLGRRVST